MLLASAATSPWRGVNGIGPGPFGHHACYRPAVSFLMEARVPAAFRRRRQFKRRKARWTHKVDLRVHLCTRSGQCPLLHHRLLVALPRPHPFNSRPARRRLQQRRHRRLLLSAPISVLGLELVWAAVVARWLRTTRRRLPDMACRWLGLHVWCRADPESARPSRRRLRKPCHCTLAVGDPLVLRG